MAPSGAVRAPRRASVSSISARSPTASGSSGISSVSTRPKRMASRERSTRVRPSPEVAVWPSV
jgi:hypothetical protein